MINGKSKTGRYKNQRKNEDKVQSPKNKFGQMPEMRNSYKKMTEHRKTKNKIKSIPSMSDFNALLDACVLSAEDKEIMRMIYVQNKTLSYIADILGYSESTIKKRHKKILSKIQKII